MLLDVGCGTGHFTRRAAAVGAQVVGLDIAALCFVPQWRKAVAEIVRVSRRRFALGLLNRNSLLWLQKGRGDGLGAYRGAHWHTTVEIAAVLGNLAVTDVRYSFGVF